MHSAQLCVDKDHLNSMWTRIWQVQINLNPTFLTVSNVMAVVPLKKKIMRFYLDFVLVSVAYFSKSLHI